MYSEIFKKYNDIYAQSKGKRTQQSNSNQAAGQQVSTAKLTNLDVAHYCKKLEKCGFIKSYNNVSTSEKKIQLTQREKLKKLTWLYGSSKQGLLSTLEDSDTSDSESEKEQSDPQEELIIDN